MSIYEWECNTDSTKKYYTDSTYLSTSTSLYIAESVEGGNVRSNSCFQSVGAANYADIPKSWGGSKEE